MPAEAPILVLLGFLLIAAVTDLTRGEIKNTTTYPGMAFGLALNGILGGTSGLQDALGGLVGCGLIMLICFVLFGIGGGDVKLIAMMGTFLGFRDGLEAMLWTFVLGGVAAVAVLIWQIGFWRILVKTAHHLWLSLRARSWVPLTDEERQPLRRSLFLAPAALVAVVIVTSERLM